MIHLLTSGKRKQTHSIKYMFTLQTITRQGNNKQRSIRKINMELKTVSQC